MARIGISGLGLFPLRSLPSSAPARTTFEFVSGSVGPQIFSSPAESGLRKITIGSTTKTRRTFFSNLRRLNSLWLAFSYGIPDTMLPDINVTAVNQERIAGKKHLTQFDETVADVCKFRWSPRQHPPPSCDSTHLVTSLRRCQHRRRRSHEDHRAASRHKGLPFAQYHQQGRRGTSSCCIVAHPSSGITRNLLLFRSH